MIKEKKIFNGFLLGSAYLESWGQWAKAGNTARNIGKIGSRLAIRRARHSGGDCCGLAVDRALAALGGDFKQLAILVYQLQLPNEVARDRLGWSAPTFEKKLACIKAAALVAIAFSQSAPSDNTDGK